MIFIKKLNFSLKFSRMESLVNSNITFISFSAYSMYKYGPLDLIQSDNRKLDRNTKRGAGAGRYSFLL